MPTLTLSDQDAASVPADAVVVAVAPAAGGSGPRLVGGEVLPAELRASLEGSLESLGVTGAADAVHRFPTGGALSAPVLALTGLGRLPDPSGPVPAETLRRAAGAATRALAGTATVALALPAPDAATAGAVAEGALLGAYAFTRYRSAARPDGGPKEPVAAVVVLTAVAGSSEAQAAAARAEVLAGAVAATRDLVNTPPVDLHPAAFAQAATEAAEGLPVEVTVLDEQALADGGYGGILAVGMGSARPPRLVRLDYRPDGAQAHLALVGKGITFDSGGLSIKPAAGMEAMKSDMSGAAAVLHTVVAAARLGLQVRLSGWLALAENMPSGTAQRPSDVITIHGGRTVEVLNTDAEGRLVLADALVAASATDPDLIVDVATLTGAQMVALGNRVSAIMANDDELRSRVHRVSEAAGEQFWPMPLPPELRASLDSPVADLANMGDRYGGMLVAGLFLAEFVGRRGAGDSTDEAGPSGTAPDGGADGGAGGGADGDPAAGGSTEGNATSAAGSPGNGGGEVIPWAHLDIAGPAFNTGKAHGYTPVGGTGVAVRTLLALVEDVVADGASATVRTDA